MNVTVSGSVVRADASEESDIDVILDIVGRRDHVVHLGQIGNLIRDVSVITGYPVDA